MSLQHARRRPAALALQDNFIHLADDGAIRSYAKTAEFLTNAGRNLDLMHGRLLAVHRISGPEDVHFSIWEMHPEGDELLFLMSGSLSVEFREDEMDRTRLPPQAGFIVPAGIWHRLIVHEPSVLISITPPHNTVHAEDDVVGEVVLGGSRRSHQRIAVDKALTARQHP